MRVFDEERADLIKIVCNEIFGEDNVHMEEYNYNGYPSLAIHVEELRHPVYMRCYVHI